MRTLTSFALAVLLAGWGSGAAFASGSDHPKERLAAKGRNCVHGYWVNESDVFFYAGDAADFNKAAADVAKKQGVKLQVVVHEGAKQARSPWDKADRNIPADWSVTTGPTARGFRATGESDLIRIDLWLGGKVKKENVNYPPDAEVGSASEFKQPREIAR